MAAQEYILCIDVGAGSIKASEFLCTAENVELNKFIYREFTTDTDDASIFDVMLSMLKQAIADGKFKAKDVYLALSGQNALIPFIKIPAMTTDPAKIRELVTYEASSRIPYPLKEVVWDYQLIGNQDGGEEIDAMLVSVKNDEVVAITDAIESAGKKVKSIEVSPTALYNSARANGIGNEQCEMILNIGGRSSTLVFLDGSRFFVRSIPVAGNTITQQIAKEFNVSFSEAEDLKRRHGFVALGGAYEEPESDVAATISKIVRNVMTRLHGEINRSINVYRATQQGRKPEKMYLAGGSSVMPFTPRFFVEKLRIPVDYFNAFQIISISSEIDKEALQEQAHLCCENIGLAMRHFRATPVEISLIPESVKRQNQLRLKRPFFYASAVSLLVYLGISYWALGEQTKELDGKLERLEVKLSEKEATKASVDREKKKLSEHEKQYDLACALVKNRNFFLDILNDIQEEYKPGKNWSSKIWFSKMEFSGRQAFGKKVAAAEDDDRQNNRRRRSRGAKSADVSSNLWLNVEGYGLRQSRDDTPASDQNDFLAGKIGCNVFGMPEVVNTVDYSSKLGISFNVSTTGGEAAAPKEINISEFNYSYPINTKAGR